MKYYTISEENILNENEAKKVLAVLSELNEIYEAPLFSVYTTAAPESLKDENARRLFLCSAGYPMNKETARQVYVILEGFSWNKIYIPSNIDITKKEKFIPKDKNDQYILNALSRIKVDAAGLTKEDALWEIFDEFSEVVGMCADENSEVIGSISDIAKSTK